jgi:uncharacterized protein (TIGR04141 family)
LFKSESGFRKLVNEKLPASHKLKDHSTSLAQDQYRIVYAIVSAESGKQLTLPFFSRLNLRAATSRLRAYGYRVALAKIPVNEELQLTKKYVKKKA